MATLEELIDELESLTPQSVDELARFVRYLKWKQDPAQAEVSGVWAFDFVEHFRRAVVSAEHDPAGMEISVGEAACGGEWRMALWEHPPLRGSAMIEYQVPVPATVRNLCLRSPPASAMGHIWPRATSSPSGCLSTAGSCGATRSTRSGGKSMSLPCPPCPAMWPASSSSPTDWQPRVGLGGVGRAQADWRKWGIIARPAWQARELPRQVTRRS